MFFIFIFFFKLPARERNRMGKGAAAGKVIATSGNKLLLSGRRIN